MGGGAGEGGQEGGGRSADNRDWGRDQGPAAGLAHGVRRSGSSGRIPALPMIRILSRSNTPRLVVMLVVIGGLMLTYEATTFDLLPWGSVRGALDPGAPVPGARLDFSATAYCKGTTTASGAALR